MRHKLIATATVVAATTIALPAAAQAKPGWRLPAVAGNGDGVANISTAKRCGKRPFGTWRFRNRAARGGVRYAVRITEDGRRHRVRKRSIRFTGRLSRKLKRQTYRLLRRARFRYVGGDAPRIETVMPNGTIQATRLFNPVRSRC